MAKECVKILQQLCILVLKIFSLHFFFFFSEWILYKCLFNSSNYIYTDLLSLYCRRTDWQIDRPAGNKSTSATQKNNSLMHCKLTNTFRLTALQNASYIQYHLTNQYKLKWGFVYMVANVPLSSPDFWHQFYNCSKRLTCVKYERTVITVYLFS